MLKGLGYLRCLSLTHMVKEGFWETVPNIFIQVVVDFLSYWENSGSSNIHGLTVSHPRWPQMGLGRPEGLGPWEACSCAKKHEAR